MRNYKQFCDQCGCEIRGNMAWTGACYKCRKEAERTYKEENDKEELDAPIILRERTNCDKIMNKIYKSYNDTPNIHNASLEVKDE